MFAYILAAAVAIASIVGVGYKSLSNLGNDVLDTQNQSIGNANLIQSAYILTTETTYNVSGYPVATPLLTGTNSPTGGGYIPAISSAVKYDGYGTALGYCTYTATSQSSPVFSIISAGRDKVFQTSCATAQLGDKAGDDKVITKSVANIIQGVGGTAYFGDPVQTLADLQSIDVSLLKNGSLRLVKDTGTLMRFDTSVNTWIEAASTGGQGGGGVSGGSAYWGDPVPSFASLTSLTNPRVGESRLILDSGKTAYWNGAAWIESAASATPGTYNLTTGSGKVVPESICGNKTGQNLELLKFKVWGAGGASMLTLYPGGAGGYAEGSLYVEPGWVLNIHVGEGGAAIGSKNGTVEHAYVTSGGASSIELSTPSCAKSLIAISGGGGFGGILSSGGSGGGAAGLDAGSNVYGPAATGGNQSNGGSHSIVTNSTVAGPIVVHNINLAGAENTGARNHVMADGAYGYGKGGGYFSNNGEGQDPNTVVTGIPANTFNYACARRNLWQSGVVASTTGGGTTFAAYMQNSEKLNAGGGGYFGGGFAMSTRGNASSTQRNMCNLTGSGGGSGYLNTAVLNGQMVAGGVDGTSPASSNIDYILNKAHGGNSPSATRITGVACGVSQLWNCQMENEFYLQSGKKGFVVIEFRGTKYAFTTPTLAPTNWVVPN